MTMQGTGGNPFVLSAIRHFKSEAKLAAAVGVTQAAINKAKRAPRVSAEMAVALEKATEGVISREDMRPDLWPSNASAA